MTVDVASAGRSGQQPLVHLQRRGRFHDNRLMPSTPVHHVIAADTHAVPPPFRTFAVRSDEPLHAFDARAPYGRVHVVHTAVLNAATLASLTTAGYAQVQIGSFADVDYAATTWPALAAASPGAANLSVNVAEALLLTGVLGADPAAYRCVSATRVDYLAARGAWFHNDVGRHWSRCLFWILTLDIGGVDFVMPHAGVRLALAPGDLVVFDQTMAHGLCRQGDGGEVVEASFQDGGQARQLFLTGELLLTDAHWAALGAPWLPVEVHARQAALDLMVAEFDGSNGAIQRLRALRDCMQRSTCHVESLAG